MAGSTRLIAGAMSGTSADGVDVAIVRIAGRGLGMSAQLLAHHHRPYDARLRGRVMAARSQSAIALGDLAELGRNISLCYAAAVNEALLATALTAADLSAVAAHGQTLFHAPPSTIQWLDPALLAAETGCAVISDFRRADCAAGGQGAPLVPYADYILFRHPTRSRALLNVGGIANVTLLPAGCSIDSLAAFDTGPGNCISDWLCRTHEPAGCGYDAQGAAAMLGRPIDAIAKRFLQAEYFHRSPPKSTDGPEMIALFEQSLDGVRYRVEDLLATAAMVVARSIADAIETVPDELIVSGGGVHNGAIMGQLRAMVPAKVLTADDLGVPSAAKEAVAFALLGAATLDGEPSNVPSATGARRRVVLGSITPRP